jgi:RNA polymerase sigma-70 factor, ECF subfamily
VGKRGSHVIDRARRGEREAFAELWRTFQAPLTRYLRIRRVASLDDVASMVWLDVATSIHRFEGDETDFRRWLFTIAHRRSVDEVRRSVRRDRLVERMGREVDAVRAIDGADVDDAGSPTDRALALVRSLPPDTAEAVMLRVVNDLAVADVARIMGTSQGNVRVLVHRGLARLRRKLVVTDAAGSAMKLVS